LVIFGFGCGSDSEEEKSDLCIYNDCDLKRESYSNLGSTFESPFPYGSPESQSFLAGSFEFKVIDYEVFRVYYF
jgi:hypothetical protein